MIINIIALLAALSVSGVAAFFSIIGLTAIFSGAFLEIIIMGSVLEVAKVVAVSWLYQNWKQTEKFIKYYLTSAVIILMFITSMGIFGYLSKAHIEQQIIINNSNVDQISTLNNQISLEKEIISDYNTKIGQIDEAIKDIREIRGGNPRDSLKYAEKYSAERQQYLEGKLASEKKINEIKTQVFLLEAEQRKLEAEVGPIKYIANVIYGQADPNQLERAVRWVIIILVFVFDPLAIVLLLAANSGIARYKKKVVKPKTRKGIIEIHKNNVKRM